MGDTSWTSLRKRLYLRLPIGYGYTKGDQPGFFRPCKCLSCLKINSDTLLNIQFWLSILTLVNFHPSFETHGLLHLRFNVSAKDCGFSTMISPARYRNVQRRYFKGHAVTLKLYCRHEYTRPYMINRICLKQLWLQVNGHAWFHLHCIGSDDLFGTGMERKIQNENVCFQWDSNPHHGSPRQESQRLRPLGHAGKISSGAFILVFWNGYVTIPEWKRLWFDTQCQVL